MPALLPHKSLQARRIAGSANAAARNFESVCNPFETPKSPRKATAAVPDGSRWRVCWVSARGKAVRTRWKSADEALAQAHDLAAHTYREIWLEPEARPSPQASSPKPLAR